MPKAGSLPSEILIAALIAVAIIATSFSGFKPTAFATAVSSCTNINAAGSYQLTANLASIGTCINITSNNTELDCNNNWINQTRFLSGTTAAVNVTIEDRQSGSLINNVTVRNCRISGFYNSIFAYVATNANITSNLIVNSTGNTNGAAITLLITNDSTVSNNQILNTTNNANGIRFAATVNATIRNNTIRNIARSGIESPLDITVKFQDNHTIENNTIEYVGRAGVELVGDTSSSQREYLRNITVSSNIIRHVGSNPGIESRTYGQNWTIKYNIIENVTSDDGIEFTGDEYGNATIFGNTIRDIYSYGIVIAAGFVENIFNNTVTTTFFGSGIAVNGWNITVYNNTVKNTPADFYGIEADGNAPAAFTLNISNNILNNNSIGIYPVGGGSLFNASVTGNYITNSRKHAVLLNTPDPVFIFINNNTFCYNNASIDNFTNSGSIRYTVGNNSFCAEPVSPANNALYTSVTSFTVNVTNTFNTTTGQRTACSLFVNGANVSHITNVTEKTNTTFNYTPTASGNWYTYCSDTFSFPNTANGTLFTLSSAAPPPSSGGGSTGGEVKLPIIPPKIKDFTLSAVTSIVQIFLGKSASNSLLIENTGEEDLAFSTLTVTGVDSSWLSLPSSLPTVSAGSSAALDIGITIPSDAVPNLYTAHTTAVADGISRSTSFDVRVEAACDGCFLAKLKNTTLTTSKNQPVYNQLTIANVGNVKLKASINTIGDTRSWALLSADETEIEPGKEQSIDIEVTPTVSEDGIYPVNITISSGARTETLAMLINLKTVPGCPVCPAPKESGACVNGKQQLQSYTCSEQTNLQCQPTTQEVSCSLVKKKKLLLPFWEAPLEHAEANLWWLLVLAALIAYAVYRYYKNRKKQKAVNPISS